MPDGWSVAAYVAATLAVLEFARKAIGTQAAPRVRGRDYLALGIALTAAATAMRAPYSLAWLDDYANTPGAGVLLSRVTAMLITICAAGLFRAIGAIAVPLRTVLAVCLVCAATMTGLYLLRDHSPVGYGAGSTTDSILPTLVYLVYMATWLIVFIRGVRKVSAGQDREIQLGLLLLALAMSAGVLGVLWSLFTVVLSVAGRSAGFIRLDPEFVANLFGAVFLTAGSVAGAIGQHLRDYRDRRHRAAIDRLWHSLANVRPVNLLLDNESPGTDQQVVEIFDAHLLLRPYIPPVADDLTAVVVNRRTFLSRRRVERVAAAARLRAALDAFQRGEPAARPQRPVNPRPHDDGLDVDNPGELTGLAEIARAWNDPVTEQIVDLVGRRGRAFRPGLRD